MRWNTGWGMLGALGIALLTLGWTSGCGSDEESKGGNGGTSGGGGSGGSGAGTGIDSLPVDETLALGCLTQPVDVVYDTRGIPHIYASSAEDALCAQGYVQARDRYPQMELIRRTAMGTLAEVLGSLDATLVEQDKAQRVLGMGRQAKANYEAAAEGSVARTWPEALVAGVNTYIEQVLQGEVVLPDGAGVIDIAMRSPAFTPWQPEEVHAIVQLQGRDVMSADRADIARTERLAEVLAAFPAGSNDADLSARAGLFSDLYGYGPAKPSAIIDGFPNLSADSGSRAALPPGPLTLPDSAMLSAARRFFERAEGWLRMGHPEEGASNNWVVSGAHTASGGPLLANDPHLGLVSPPFWYLVHVNTARAGGDIDVFGAGVPGTPIPVFGHNRNVAWGLTNTQFDISDVWLETITETGGSASVLLDGSQVPIETVEEVVEDAGGNSQTINVEIVPHHGPILPDTRTATSGMSLRWVGDEQHDSLSLIQKMWTAESIEDVEDALDANGVLSNNFVVVTAAGDIFWTTQSRLPTRTDGACTYAVDADGVPSGNVPMLVLPGTGEAEWTGYLEDRYLPHLLNPASGFIATANQDQIGATHDGDPCNDPWYLGGPAFAEGWRQARIVERLEELTAANGVTSDDMVALQADARSSLGADLRDALLASLDNALEEYATPRSHPDLSAAVTAAGDAGMARIADLRDRLGAWSLDTPHGVGATDASEVADSVATTVFNVGLRKLVHLMLDDEFAVLGWGRSGAIARLLAFALTDPTRLFTSDAQTGESVLWDDLNTREQETRDERVLSAFLAANTELEASLGADVDQWRWGKLHTVRFGALVPSLPWKEDVISVPPPSSSEFPDGFPRHGDNHVVDRSDSGIWGDTYNYTHGPSLRIVVEMTPDGPKARGALPGGQSFDPASPHHADEAELWRKNEAPPFFFEESDVVANAERHVRFEPAL